MREPKIVAYSKTAPFKGGKGYLLWEYPAHWGSRCGDLDSYWVPAQHRKTPMPDFLRLVFK
jgi:hypothetical protein